ncbi:hypothetical protein CEXT_759371 [Caerostris extrusa]|uniref:Uncharacterized protein n=1 Tax=Caerostris extrusa TaxID=172846 RepID=A0AAV4NZ56_CAEEX|nr:hypothetical protein CEXT_759371 [Caerostris extrusa]
MMRRIFMHSRRADAMVCENNWRSATLRVPSRMNSGSKFWSPEWAQEGGDHDLSAFIFSICIALCLFCPKCCRLLGKTLSTRCVLCLIDRSLALLLWQLNYQQGMRMFDRSCMSPSEGSDSADVDSTMQIIPFT